MNRLAQVNNRIFEVEEELLWIEEEKAPAQTAHGYGDEFEAFDHAEWLEAEREELLEEMEQAYEVVTVEGDANYDG